MPGLGGSSPGEMPASHPTSAMSRMISADAAASKPMSAPGPRDTMLSNQYRSRDPTVTLTIDTPRS